jgi:hypothetical protein
MTARTVERLAGRTGWAVRPTADRRSAGRALRPPTFRYRATPGVSRRGFAAASGVLSERLNQARRAWAERAYSLRAGGCAACLLRYPRPGHDRWARGRPTTDEAWLGTVSAEGWQGDDRSASLSVAELAILSNGRRVLLHEERGFTLGIQPSGDPLSGLITSVLERDVLAVVLPDDRDDDPRRSTRTTGSPGCAPSAAWRSPLTSFGGCRTWWSSAVGCLKPWQPHVTTRDRAGESRRPALVDADGGQNAIPPRSATMTRR